MRGLSGNRIPLPKMPRAKNLAVLHHSLPQWATAMQADILHRGDGSIHIGNADHLAAAGKFFGLVWGREFGFRGELGEHLALST